MTRLAIISNPLSDGNSGRKGIPANPDRALLRPDTLFAAPAALEELPGVLHGFAEAGVEMLAIDGGDGTVRDVISLLPWTFGDAWPTLAILPSGKTNVIARDVGGFGHGAAGMAHLFFRLDNKPLRFAERPCLDVSWIDDAQHQHTALGFVLGAAVYSHATQMAGAWSHDRGIKQGGAVALVIARMLAKWRRGDATEGVAELSLTPETEIAAPPAPHFLVLATTLDRLMLGLWPFPKGGRGGLHWLAMTAPPQHLVRNLWRAWRGKVALGEGVRGGRAETLEMRLSEPFVLDGELYDPGIGCVTVRTGPTLRFLVP
jgi:hypothetical protein